MRPYADDTIFYSVNRTPTDSTQLQDDLRILESWKRMWLMLFKVEKCYQLTMNKNRKRIPTRHIPHN